MSLFVDIVKMVLVFVFGLLWFDVKWFGCNGSVSGVCNGENSVVV